jgi:peptide/nickel transport system permease protein
VSVTISENTRAAVLEVSSQDFVMVARAKGLLPRTILQNYLLRNALTPIITVTGLQVASLLGGSIWSRPSSQSPAWASICSSRSRAATTR